MEFKGLIHLVKTAVEGVKKFIEKLKDEIKTISLPINQEEARVIKEHGIIELMEKNYHAKASLSNSVRLDIELTLPYGKVTLTRRSTNMILDKGCLAMVFNDQDMQKRSKDKTITNDKTATYLYNHEGRVCLVRSTDMVVKLNYPKDATLLMVPPEDRPLKEFFIELLNILKSYKPKEPFTVYICTRHHSDTPSKEYLQLEE